VTSAPPQVTICSNGTVSEHNVSGGSKSDRRRGFELCQHAGYGLTAKSQIIGNVLATDRQSIFVAELNAVVHLEQEADHPFRGALVEQ
jgi:hypothetical protein